MSTKTKTREIEVWVDKENIESNKEEIMVWHKVSLFQSMHLLKAKLIIEIPEKSVSITESQFEELIYKCEHATFNQLASHLKQKLFGEGEEG